jgi:microcystin-dependent protein
MSQPFLGEIRMFAGNFAPSGWAFCAGQQMDISQNTALFSLLGTTYGGDGVSTFNLPDLRSRMPVHAGTGGGSNYLLGQSGGVETVTLLSNQLPAHNHSAAVSSLHGNSDDPTSKVPAASATSLYTAPGGTLATMTGAAIGSVGGNQPHNNMPPYQAVNFIIALQGIFPSRN